MWASAATCDVLAKAENRAFNAHRANRDGRDEFLMKAFMRACRYLSANGFGRARKGQDICVMAEADRYFRRSMTSDRADSVRYCLNEEDAGEEDAGGEDGGAGRSAHEGVILSVSEVVRAAVGLAEQRRSNSP